MRRLLCRRKRGAMVVCNEYVMYGSATHKRHSRRDTTYDVLVRIIETADMDDA